MRPIRSLVAGLSLIGLCLAGNLGAAESPSDEHALRHPTPVDVPDWADKGVAWLIAAQHQDGGWGAGSQAAQQIKDPHAVPTDPATTAFAALALLRIGNTASSGPQAPALARALVYLATAVENAPAAGGSITALRGTQIQGKLGPMIDTAMTAQALARALPTFALEDPLRARVDAALTTCIARLQTSQQAEGHWGGGGWAPVLQASTACSALEIAQASGKTVDGAVLARARDWQKGNVRAPAATGGDGATVAGSLSPAAPVAAMSAGVALYAYSGGQRANAAESSAARALVEEGKKDGRLAADARVDATSLRKMVSAERADALAASVVQSDAQAKRVVGDDQLLAGFGNNGGEEYLSYLMTTESLVIDRGEAYDQWMAKMTTRLPKAQNQDGSWSGHHCITSPVFCTAAVVQVAAAEAEAPFLRRVAAVAAKVEAKPATGNAP